MPRRDCIAARLLAAIAGALLALCAMTANAAPQAPGFALKVDGLAVDLPLFSVFVLPHETLTLQITDHQAPRGISVRASAGTVNRIGHGRWYWRAPAGNGLVSLEVIDPATRHRVQINAFVLVPLQSVRDGAIEGYEIGNYPPSDSPSDPHFNPPKGFVEVSKVLVDTPVSPHFTLGQFLCKQESDWPKYLALKLPLLLKLERIITALNATGVPTAGLEVMSGFRTPVYNASLGNVAYSRHIYGDAADVFVDNDGDGNMDDLNADGVIDTDDALWLREQIEVMTGEPWYEPLVGGMSAYRANAYHGPFLHVDTRGYHARW